MLLQASLTWRMRCTSLLKIDLNSSLASIPILLHLMHANGKDKHEKRLSSIEGTVSLLDKKIKKNDKKRGQTGRLHTDTSRIFFFFLFPLSNWCFAAAALMCVFWSGEGSTTHIKIQSPAELLTPVNFWHKINISFISVSRNVLILIGVNIALLIYLLCWKDFIRGVKYPSSRSHSLRLKEIQLVKENDISKISKTVSWKYQVLQWTMKLSSEAAEDSVSKPRTHSLEILQ